MTSRFHLPALGLCLALSLTLSGCGASLPGLSTGSLFGGDSAAKAPPPPANDPTSRAIQVGSTSARALKCGFNFDPVKLRTQFIANEAMATTTPADADKIGQVYDTAFRGVSKAISEQGEGYCSPHKTQTIKEALNRHLAGDYTPAPREPVEEDDGGLFGSLGGGSGSEYKASNPWDRNE
ncbi:MAG: hypothetical protein WBP38_04015 [Hyphomicrobium sp.]|jgi:hypothetical protein|nr:hypothetical protein [Hyphomicrobium sp.]